MESLIPKNTIFFPAKIWLMNCYSYRPRDVWIPKLFTRMWKSEEEFRWFQKGACKEICLKERLQNGDWRALSIKLTWIIHVKHLFGYLAVINISITVYLSWRSKTNCKKICLFICSFTFKFIYYLFENVCYTIKGPSIVTYHSFSVSSWV